MQLELNFGWGCGVFDTVGCFKLPCPCYEHVRQEMFSGLVRCELRGKATSNPKASISIDIPQ